MSFQTSLLSLLLAIFTEEFAIRGTHSTYNKLAVQCSADTFVVNQNWFSASTFVVKIANFL